MTRPEFIGLIPGDIIHFGNCTRVTGPRGGIKEHVEAYTVTNVRTWKRDTDRRVVSAKRGMYEHVQLTNGNAAYYGQFHLAASACPLLDDDDHYATDTHNARVQDVTSPMLPDMTFYRVVCTCGLVTRESRTTAEHAVEYHMNGGTVDRVHDIMARDIFAALER